MLRSQQQQGSECSQHSFPFKKADRFRSASLCRGWDRELLSWIARLNAHKPNRSKAPTAVSTPSRSKKRTGLGPHSLPGLGQETSVLDCAAECAEANSSKVPTAVSASSYSKKRTGFGPHLCPQIRGISQGYWGYVRSSELGLQPSGWVDFRHSAQNILASRV